MLRTQSAVAAIMGCPITRCWLPRFSAHVQRNERHLCQLYGTPFRYLSNIRTVYEEA